MSLIRFQSFLLQYNNISIRTICTSKQFYCEKKLNTTNKETNTNTTVTTGTGTAVPITKDRSQVIPVETSIKYLKSHAYRETYGDQPVWTQYRRNFKGAFAPKKTRKTCIRNQVIATGNPCPICRDEYLVLSEQNPELLKQFICPHTGSILSYQKTGLCQKKHFELLVSVQRARDRGILTFDVPFRHYDYNLYYQL